MAGSVARITVCNVTDIYNVNAHYSDVSRNKYEFISLADEKENVMDENVILEYLTDQRLQKRSEALDDLRKRARRNDGSLLFTRQRALFQALSLVLEDASWEIRLHCIHFISELLPYLGYEVDIYMRIVFPKLLPNIAHNRASIRRSVIQTIHLYMKSSNDIQVVLKSIVLYGLNCEDKAIRQETAINLPMLLTMEFAGEDFFVIVQSLAKMLLESYDDDNLQKPSLIALEKVKDLVGNETFTSYLAKLTQPLRHYYFKFSNGETEGINKLDYNSNTPSHNLKDSREEHYPFSNPSPKKREMQYAVVPKNIISQLSDLNDWKMRLQGVNDLKSVIKDTENLYPLIPSLGEFIRFLALLMDDDNFKIVIETLEIIGFLVKRLRQNIRPHLEIVLAALSKRLGDSKIVVRHSNMQVIMQLMHIFTVKPVLALITDNLQHKNSRVREETLNVIIASLLVFPSNDFDLVDLCHRMAATLIDSKKKVRHAALECFALLAQAMGPGKLQPLVLAIETVENKYDIEGALQAVQARLARRQLPKLTPDGLVEYAVQIPSSASYRSPAAVSHGTDVEWIMAGSGGMRQSSPRHKIDDSDIDRSGSSQEPLGPPTRRYVSAGRARNRLPWEAEDAGTDDKKLDKSSDIAHPSSAPVHQCRTSLGPFSMREEYSQDLGNPPRLLHSMPQPPYESILGSGISYRQLQKLRRTSADKLTTSLNGCSDDSEKAFIPTKSTPLKAFGPIPWLDDNDRSISKRESQESFTQDMNYTKSHKKVLNPIRVTPETSETEDESGESIHRKSYQEIEDSPIPLRPTLARIPSGGRRKKIPAIPISDQDDVVTPESLNSNSMENTPRPLSNQTDTGLDLERTEPELESQEEIHNSLRQLRNSAAKKRAKKLKETRSATSNSASPSPPPDPLAESGIYSPTMFLQQHCDNIDKISPLSSPYKSLLTKNSGEESPFEPRPRLIRSSSLQFRNSPSEDELFYGGSLDNLNKSGEKNPFDLKIKNSLSENLTQSAKGRRIAKSCPNSSDLILDQINHDRIGIVGKGVFGSSSSLIAAGSDSPFFPGSKSRKTLHSRQGSRTSIADNFEVNGIGLMTVESISTLEPRSDSENLRIEEEFRKSHNLERKIRSWPEDHPGLLPEISEPCRDLPTDTLTDELFQREERKLNPWDEMIPRGQSNLDDSGIESMASTASYQSRPLPVKNSTSRRKPQSPSTLSDDSGKSTLGGSKIATLQRSITRSHSNLTQALSDEVANMDKPFNNPEMATKMIQQCLANDDWNVKCDGMSYIKRLSIYHPNEMIPQLHSMILALISEVKNLRSSVSRAAVCCLGELFTNLKKSMEPDLEITVKALLAKNGESCGFIREDVEKTLMAMIEEVSPNRAILALIAGGATHKNTAIRKTTAQFVSEMVEKMGGHKVLSGAKDITDKILPTASQFVMDGSPETRFFGRKIFSILLPYPEFDRMMNKYLPDNIRRNIKDVLDGLRQKGLSDPPSEIIGGSLKSRPKRSSSLSKGTPPSQEKGSVRRFNAAEGTDSRKSSTQSCASERRGRSEKRNSATNKIDAQTTEDIRTIIDNLAASDWRIRDQGLTQLQEICVSNVQVVVPHIVKIFDKVCQRLTESNSKVNLHAIQTLHHILPIIGEYLGPTIPVLMPALTQAMASNSREISVLAEETVDMLTEYTDGSILVQPFAKISQFGNPKIKAIMVEKTAYLVIKVYDRKPKQVSMHALPLLWHLLSIVTGSGTVLGMAGNLRQSTCKLCQALHVKMGDSLLDQANILSFKEVKILQDLIHTPL